MKKNPLLGLLLFACLLFIQSLNAQNLRMLYLDAMRDAVYPDSSKVDTCLVSITQQNPDLTWKSFNGVPHVLMVTWKSVSYYPNGGDSIYNTSQYPIWVTTSPQLKNWFHQQNIADTNLRLKQLLGLPPVGSEYKYFVEFWVNPADLFRPCPDNEINDQACTTCLAANTDSAYVKWFNDSRISRYYACQLYDQYPWTQLGYTYDWNPDNPTHFGMSEFVIKPNVNIYVKRVCTTKQYLN